MPSDAWCSVRRSMLFVRAFVLLLCSVIYPDLIWNAYRVWYTRTVSRRFRVTPVNQAFSQQRRSSPLDGLLDSVKRDRVSIVSPLSRSLATSQLAVLD